MGGRDGGVLGIRNPQGLKDNLGGLLEAAPRGLVETSFASQGIWELHCAHLANSLSLQPRPA